MLSGYAANILLIVTGFLACLLVVAILVAIHFFTRPPRAVSDRYRLRAEWAQWIKQEVLPGFVEDKAVMEKIEKELRRSLNTYDL